MKPKKIKPVRAWAFARKHDGRIVYVCFIKPDHKYTDERIVRVEIRPVARKRKR